MSSTEVMPPLNDWVPPQRPRPGPIPVPAGARGRDTFLFVGCTDSTAVEEDVLGRDAAGTMAFLLEQRRRAEQAAAHELRAVTHWADLHRVGAGQLGSVDPEVWSAVAADSYAGSLADPGCEGLEGQLRLAGEGAFTVAEFAVTDIAAGLGMSEPAARAYVGQALELRDRLPRLWGQVMDGRLPAWKARQVAAETIPLTRATAAYVDRQLAPFTGKLSLRRIRRAVDAAVLRHDPAVAEQRTTAAAERRGVWLEDDLEGTTTVTAVTGTPDAHALDSALTQLAASLAALGDADALQVRRAKALGVLADPQYALDLHTTAHATSSTGDAGCPPQPLRRSTTGPIFHVHLHTDAVTGVPGVEGTGHLARVTRFGARSLDAVQHWLADLAPGAVVKVTPVVDLTTPLSVDAHEAPDRLRNQIEERDLCCVFPWCGREGRYDLDHIDPYLPPGDGGPPGQTHTGNLARLCRFHHRVKTHGRWRYHRQPDGTLMWTSPLGRRYTVDQTGTSAARLRTEP